MATVGAYILSTRDRKGGEPDPKTAPAQALKLVGAQPLSFAGLLSRTGWQEDFLRTVVADLRQRQMIAGTNDMLSLTDLGLKARFIVAA